jgi:hypothetical protein
MKIWALGIFVEILTTHDTWSKVVLARGWTIVFGNFKVNWHVVKNQSSCSNKGLSCILDHVNLLPFKGSSIRPRWLIILLKRKISFILAPGLFLLSVDLIKLKSPSISQCSLEVMYKLWSHWTKSSLAWPLQGPYTFTNVQLSKLLVEVNWLILNTGLLETKFLSSGV